GQPGLGVGAERAPGGGDGVDGHRTQPSRGRCGMVGTTSTGGPSASSAALNSAASMSVLSTFTARHPKPVATAAMSSPGRLSPGTFGVSSSSANDLRIAYSPLRSTTNTIGSLCCAAVHSAWMEYWKEP